MWRKCWRVRETPVRTQRRSWRGGRPDRGPAGSAHCCSPAAKGEGRRRHRGRRTTREVACHGRRQTRTVGTAALTEDTGRCRSEAAGPTRGRGHFPPRPQVSPQRPRTPPSPSKSPSRFCRQKIRPAIHVESSGTPNSRANRRLWCGAGRLPSPLCPGHRDPGAGGRGTGTGPPRDGLWGGAGWGEAGHGRPRPARPYPDPSPGPACTAEHLSGVVPSPGPCPTAPHPQAHLPPSHSRQVAWVLSAAHRLLVRLELEPVPVQECAHMSVHACV